ncbi:unnamed protein product [Clonostachys byssicola]|uniref:Uncharacterized protein n=1 Tax=Clonostachys byssicola TaxID=160290 RepID=A0A9N9UJ15_9HYPO|nr:unnamed protein product [Clonostachys byssicola]
MIFDPALDDYIDYSLTNEADDQKRSNEATDGRLFSRDAINSRAGSPSTFLEHESFDVAQDQEGDGPASKPPSSSHTSPMHLAVAYRTDAADSELEKSIYGRTLPTFDYTAFPLADEHNMFAPRVKDVGPYHFWSCKSQQTLPRINEVLRNTAWSDETPDDSGLQRPTSIHTPYPLNSLVQNNENSHFQFSKKGEIAASDLPSYDGPNFREHPLYKDAAIGSDQLYHCPWEGKADCNHVPTDAKCTYK